MKNHILITSILILSCLFSCNYKTNEKSSAQTAEMNISVSTNNEKIGEIAFTPPNVVEDEKIIVNENKEPISDKLTIKIDKKKIIKDGNISIESRDIIKSKRNIDIVIKKFNGYYEKENLENNTERISYNLKIRIPASNFENLILALENGDDEIKGKNIQARDVTEEFLDIVSRLNNKREFLKRYKFLLSRASTVKDILAIEENIAVLQEEIESKEGRLKYLKDQVDFSTIEINLYKNIAFVYKREQKDNFFERVKKSLSSGWESIINFILWLITIWPFTILFMIVLVVIRKFLKKRKRNIG